MLLVACGGAMAVVMVDGAAAVNVVHSAWLFLRHGGTLGMAIRSAWLLSRHWYTLDMALRFVGDCFAVFYFRVQTLRVGLSSTPPTKRMYRMTHRGSIFLWEKISCYVVSVHICHVLTLCLIYKLFYSTSDDGLQSRLRPDGAEHTLSYGVEKPAPRVLAEVRHSAHPQGARKLLNSSARPSRYHAPSSQVL